MAVEKNSSAEKQMRFSVYKHTFVFKDNQLVSRNFIVLKSEDGKIIFTDFHRYLRNPKHPIKSISNDNEMRCYNVVKLLNYAFFDKYHIEKLTDMTVEIAKAFVNDYGLGNVPGDDDDIHRSRNTVEKCVSDVIDFLTVLIRENILPKIHEDDLYRKVDKYSKSKKRYFRKKVPNFEVLYNAAPRHIFRDIPEGAFQILMNTIVTHHRNLLMLAALGAFAGLRPSEACNVRREDSPLGPGIRFEMVNGEVTNVYIDLRRELSIRSDLISVGGIKKERMQRVHPVFLEVFMECYNIYMDYVKGRKYEADYGALTNNISGRALTYDSYYAEFRKAVQESIPVMLNDADPEIVNYGQLLLENRISPHIFRHWFSVKLTLNGEDVSGLMFWRGDRSPESALTYLQNKGDLEKQYAKVNNELFKYTSWKAEKIING